MFDWRKRVDSYQEQLGEEAKGKRLEDQRRQNELKTEQERQEQKEFNRKLKILQANFQCVVCGKLPTGPKPGYWSGSDASVENPSSYNPPDWNNPNGLEKCALGDHYVCKDHIHKGICQKCAEKL